MNDKKYLIYKGRKIPLNNQSIDIGKISDGYHTFDELYKHRTLLFASLCLVPGIDSWKSKKHSDGTMYDGMFIVGINTKFGQATYHCENEYWKYFDRVKELPMAPKYDGHDPDTAIDRIFRTFSI